MKNLLENIKKQYEDKKAFNKQKAEKLLSKTYTRDDFIDIQAKWKMLDWTDEERKIVEDYADFLSKCLNLATCACVSHANLNGLNTFENAEQKGLTEEMDENQKQLLRKLSKQVKIDRVLFISRKCAANIALLIAMTNFIIAMYWKDLYKTIQPTETYVFLCIIMTWFGLFLTNKRSIKKISKNIFKIIEQKTL